MGFKFEKTEYYIEWESELTSKPRAQVDKRLSNIELHEHFDDTRYLGDGLAELKFRMELGSILQLRKKIIKSSFFC